MLRALAGPHGDELRSLLGAPIEGEVWERARQLVRKGTAIDESVEAARAYVTRATELLAPFGERPAAVALAGAAHHLVDSLAAVRA